MQRKLTKRMAVAIGAAAVLAFAAAGCGTKTIDHDSEVDLVNKQLESDNLKAKSIDCPDDVEAKEGETFECDVTLTDGNTGTYTITVEKVSGDNASLRVTDAKNTSKK
ncbi:MAG TPA: DUF4333 domain-containing protein [Solirubrobacterales bacterium]|nr:DUF4333 domain-containing protein [Solirubrobacterales bacterium]